MVNDGSLLFAAIAALAAGLAVLCAVLAAKLRQRDASIRAQAHSARILGTALETMTDGFVVWDEDNRLMLCNEVYRRMYEISRPVLVKGALFDDIIRWGAEAGQYADAVGRVDEFVAAVVAWQRGGAGSVQRRLGDGRWIQITERRMANGCTVGIRTDITALKQALAELAAANERAEAAAVEAIARTEALRQRDEALNARNALFEAALSNMSHGLAMIDAEGRLIVGNRQFCELFGLDETMLAPGMPAKALHQAIERSGLLGEAAIAQILSNQRDLARHRNPVAFVITTLAGRAIAVTQRPLDDGGWVAICEDITSRRVVERRVRFLALHDDLTKLPNRVHFRSRIDEALAQKRRHGTAFALLYLDLDRFKGVNDTYGHEVGDALLKAVVRRLRASVRPGDFVARLGGDEFAVLQASVTDDRRPEVLGQALVAAIDPPFELMGHRISIGVSAGIAIAEGDDPDVDRILREADLAAYQAKKSGRGTCVVYEPILDQTRRHRFALEADLREALERQDLSLRYQPLFNLDQGGVSGFEALARWHHPERGWISPVEFVPLAEGSGLVDDLGAWVIRQACHDIARLPGAPKVAVNLSTQQLRSDAILEVIADALRRSGLAPERLELEITETALLTEVLGTASLLHRLRDLGAHIVLDDFGTGYSSLSHLRSFPLSKIKIDQSFVQDMATNRQSAAIVSSTVELAAKLGMLTTAEGIETAELLDLARSMNCTEAQGYHLGRPVPILEAVEALGTRIAPMPRRRLLASA